MNISIFHHPILWQIVCIGLTGARGYGYTAHPKNRSTGLLRPLRGIHDTRTDYIKMSLIDGQYYIL